MLKTFPGHTLYLEIAFKAIPLILHATGIYFLYKFRRCYSNKSHLLYLVNLSLIEIVFVSTGLLWHILLECGLERAAYYTQTIQYSTVCLHYFLSMIYMTVDRFMEVRLNIVYPVYWKYRYTKILLLSSWIVCALLSFGIMLIDLPERKYTNQIIFLYFYPIFESIFITLSTCIYGYIFSRLRRNNCHVYRANSGLMRRRKKKHFYVPALIVVSFILLVAVPDFIGAVYLARNIRLPVAMATYIYCSYMIGMSCDAIVYIFFSPYIRRFWKRFCCDRCRNGDDAKGAKLRMIRHQHSSTV